MVGSPATMAAAMSTLYFLTLFDVLAMLFKPTVMGLLSAPLKVTPNRKSFQMLVNCQISVTIKIRVDLGSTMRQHQPRYGAGQAQKAQHLAHGQEHHLKRHEQPEQQETK